MAMRMTGLVSGMDTESMVKELVSASSEKVNKIKQKKQDVEWKKEIWSGLNTKIYNFYKTQLSAFKTVMPVQQGMSSLLSSILKNICVDMS